MGEYEPELGQAMFGNATGQYEVPDYVDALILYLVQEWERIHWNTQQEEFDHYTNHALGNLVWRPYWWGKDDAPEVVLPNLEFNDVEIRWYKHIGRGMSVNVKWYPNEWVDWFDDCLAHIRSRDSKL